MRRMAILKLSVWVAVIGSIALVALFWRIGYFRPHFLWGILSLAAMLIPTERLAFADAAAARFVGGRANYFAALGRIALRKDRQIRFPPVLASGTSFFLLSPALPMEQGRPTGARIPERKRLELFYSLCRNQ